MLAENGPKKRRPPPTLETVRGLYIPQILIGQSLVGYGPKLYFNSPDILLFLPFQGKQNGEKEKTSSILSRGPSSFPDLRNQSETLGAATGNRRQVHSRRTPYSSLLIQCLFIVLMRCSCAEIEKDSRLTDAMFNFLLLK